MRFRDLKFKNIRFRNFMSYGNQYHELSLDVESISTLIVGINRDAANHGESNGVGKSTIANAICYALFNKPFDNISLQRLINTTNSSKQTLMEVWLYFDVGADEYCVYRCRGEYCTIKITKNDEDITLDSVSNNDKFVEDIIGISYDLFTSIIIFSGNSVPFLMRPIAQQRLLTEELFRITTLSEKAVKLKQMIKETEQSISLIEAVEKQKKAVYDNHLRQIQITKGKVESWDDTRKAEIAAIINSVEIYSLIDFDEQERLITEFTALTMQRNEKVLSRKMHEKTFSQNTSEANKLIKELEHLRDATCPYCKQHYEANDELIAEKTLILDSLEQNSASIESQITSLSNEIRELDSKINDVKPQLIFESLNELHSEKTLFAVSSEKIAALQTKANPYLETIAHLQDNTPVNADMTKVDEGKRLLEHQHFLLKLLTDKNSFIRRKILQKTIPYLNQQLNKYTRVLGLPHLVKFDDDMSCSVAQFGRELDFGNLSSGQKKRVNLAMSLAFRDVLQRYHGHVNLMFIDEIEASLDTNGVENIFRLLKQKMRDDHMPIWIISHRPEASGYFDRNLYVILENGFSHMTFESTEEF